MSDPQISSEYKGDIVAKLAANFTLEKALKAFAQIAELHEVADTFMIALYDDSDKTLVFRHVKMHSPFQGMKTIFEHYRIPITNEDPVAHAFVENVELKIKEKHMTMRGNYNHVSRFRFERWNIREMVVSPLEHNDTKFGVFIGFMHNKDISHAKLMRFKTDSEFLIPHLFNAYNLETYRTRDEIAKSAIEERREFLTLLSQLNMLQDEESLYKTLPERFLMIFSEFNLGSITVYDEKENLLSVRSTCITDSKYKVQKERFEAIYAYIKQKPNPEEGAVATVFYNNARSYIVNVQEVLHLPMSDIDKVGAEFAQIKSILHVPIRFNKKPIAVMTLLSFDDVIELNEQQLIAVDLLCDIVGTSIMNAQLYTKDIESREEITALKAKLEMENEDLQQENAQDDLTKLYNRKGIENILKNISAMNEGYFSILFLDIDHFKKFNDTYGHLCGDACLKLFAQKVKEFSRGVDKVARWGGEEFLVVLPQCKLNAALQVAERIRKGIELSILKFEGQELQVTTSIGCTEWHQAEDYQSTVDRADRALYQAKDSGRNKVASKEFKLL